MSEAQQRRMTPDEFFEWQTRQDKNYELVDGLPLLSLKAMTGATLRHDRVTTNAMVSLGSQLRGSPCRPETTDIAVRIPAGGIRRPDLTIDCGPLNDIAMEAQDPRVVLEVLSPSTINVDRFRKLDEYKSHPAIRVIILADTRAPNVAVWRRHEVGWTREDYEGLQAMVPLPEINADLSLSDLYDGLTFEG
jgi:Uma2 family endonuclease